MVIGAGYVGAAFAAHRAAAGDRVVAVRRTADPLPIPGVTWIAGDARAPEALAGLPPSADAVVLAAAPSRDRGDTHATTYAPLAAGALAIARRLGARVVAYTSSTGVYGYLDGRRVDEETPRAPRSPDAAALVAAEDVLLAAGDVRPVVLRVAGIYGPGRSPMGRFLRPAALPARGAYAVNFAHRDDIIAALDVMLARDGAPHVVNVADGAPMLAIDVARWVHDWTRTPWPDPVVFDAPDAPPRSHQYVVVDRLRSLGWSPRWPDVRAGLAGLAGDAAAGTPPAVHSPSP